MGNYHGYKCRECGEELDGLRNENERTEHRLQGEVVNSWDAVFWCNNGHGELWLTIEEHILTDEFGDSDVIESSQEIVASHWQVINSI